MDKAIHVSCIIDKLSPFWKDFKHALKHKKEELTLVELGSHLLIEESLKDDDVASWVDSGATIHMGNESTSLVHERGCVDLRFSSGKIVSMFNVLHVHDIRKNLVSSSILNNCGYKQVIESNKFVLSKHGLSHGFWGEAV
nr:zinc finger, CCHC-type [Tanacetum cinerariifolium]